MQPDFSPLDSYLDEADLDGYLMDDDSTLSNQYYLSGFDGPDPFITLYTPDTIAILTSTLEYQRATQESRADAVRRWSDYDYQSKKADHGRETARALAFGEFLEEFDVEAIGANRRFPLFTADSLREQGFTVEADLDEVLDDIRSRKTPAEIAHIREAQQANESAMARAESMIADADVAEDDTLVLEGETLTSERVKAAIERELLDLGFSLDETIVACGPDGAVPHDRGSGPLEADQPIIIDIFPRSKTSKYHADMTRTFLKGDPDPRIEEFYAATQDAVEAAFEATEPGATGEEVHDAVCDVYEEAGYPTIREDEGADWGFIHSTGHGVGLDVHELPRVATDGEELEPGHVITIEPGLYDPEIGGVRIEDLIVVTEDGFENLTEYHETLVI